MDEKGEKGGAVAAERYDEVAAAKKEEERSSSSSSSSSSRMRTADTLLRLLPMGPCVVALVVMLKNSQTNDFGSVSYSDLGAFRYLVNANGICVGYCLLSAIVAAMPRPFTTSRAWTFFFLDQVMTYVILGAGAVSIEVLYLAYKGDSAITWSAACGSFGIFCHKAMTSIAITFVAVACFVALSLLSSYKLFSRYNAPSIGNNGDPFGGKGIVINNAAFLR